MATWTYFTAYLDGTRPILKTERDELLDNAAALLATTGCSAAGYSLNAGTLTAVKASGLITDRARLDGPSASITRNRLETLLATASTAFSNYSAAVTTALSGEGISSTERDNILASNLDDHRLWNYYKRLIDALTCFGITSVQCRTRSASKSKCGFAEYGTPSSPPKYYRTRTLSGSITDEIFSDPSCTTCTLKTVVSFSGACSYATDCSFSSTVSISREEFSPCSTSVSTENCNRCVMDSGGSLSCFFDTGATGLSTSTTPTSFSVTGSGVCNVATPNFRTSGSAAETLSNEFTTATLISVAETAVAAASWSTYGSLCIGAVYSLTSDETSLTLRDIQYRFNFSSAAPAGHKLEFDITDGLGTVISHVCVNLTAGVTEYVHTVTHPSANGSRFIENWTVVAGTC